MPEQRESQPELSVAEQHQRWQLFVDGDLQFLLSGFEDSIHEHPQPLSQVDVLQWLKDPTVQDAITNHAKGIEAEPVQTLTAEAIKANTDYSLAMIFTGFARENGYISPDLHEERERLSEMLGEDNVLPSFFVDESGTTQLGLFTRKLA